MVESKKKFPKIYAVDKVCKKFPQKSIATPLAPRNVQATVTCVMRAAESADFALVDAKHQRCLNDVRQGFHLKVTKHCLEQRKSMLRSNRVQSESKHDPRRICPWLLGTWRARGDTKKF